MKRAGLLVPVLALVVVAGLSLAPQAAAQSDRALTEQEAKQTLKESRKLLTAAERAQKRGDTPAVEQNLAAFNERMTRLNEAVAAGRVDPAEAQTVLERVDAATRKHLRVLERVHERCRDRGRSCQGIERALEASRHGNQAATAALARHRSEHPEHPQRTGRPGMQGQPGGMHRGERGPGVDRGPGGGRPGGGRPGGSRPGGGRPPRG